MPLEATESREGRLGDAAGSPPVPVGVVSLRPERSAPEAALLAHCRTMLVAFKVPAAVLVVAAIPKNANGKIDRQALTTLWEARRP